MCTVSVVFPLFCLTPVYAELKSCKFHTAFLCIVAVDTYMYSSCRILCLAFFILADIVMGYFGQVSVNTKAL
jgi:hypothetical protein